MQDRINHMIALVILNLINSERFKRLKSIIATLIHKK